MSALGCLRERTHSIQLRTLAVVDASPPVFAAVSAGARSDSFRSEEHTSELQSRSDLVCRLLLEKKKKRELYFLATLYMSKNEVGTANSRRATFLPRQAPDVTFIFVHISWKIRVVGVYVCADRTV